MSSPIADPAYAGSMDDGARRAQRFAAWQAHSRRIHIYRKGLPGVIGAIVLVMVGWVTVKTVLGRLQGQSTERISIRMINPRFFGRGGDNIPYVISGRSAARDERNFQRVVMDMPVFIQNPNTESQTEVRARYGVYMEDSRVLRLENDVVLIDLRGYQFKTTGSVIDTRAGLLSGQSPIAGVGPLGQIAASSYSVEDGGAKLVFRGKVRTRIETNRKGTDAPDALGAKR